MGERMRRQETNPITGEVMGGPSGAPAPSGSHKPPGNLGVGLVPHRGPLDNGLLTGKDVPSKRIDPTKNQSNSLQSGVSCMAHEEPLVLPTQPSRVTESCFGEGMCERFTPTPDRESSSRGSRRSTPGQVVRSNLRPKDNLSAGCLTSDQPGDHPLNLRRKAGAAGPGIGSGGHCNILQGPNGFVPRGPENFDNQPPPRSSGYSAQRPFQRVCGAAAAMAY